MPVPLCRPVGSGRREPLREGGEDDVSRLNERGRVAGRGGVHVCTVRGTVYVDGGRVRGDALHDAERVPGIYRPVREHDPRSRVVQSPVSGVRLRDRTRNERRVQRGAEHVNALLQEVAARRTSTNRHRHTQGFNDIQGTVAFITCLIFLITPYKARICSHCLVYLSLNLLR